MSFSTISYESIDGVALITMKRPEKRNALNGKMVSELNEAWRRFEDGDERCAVLAGEGDHFSVGADINDVPPELWRGIPSTAAAFTKPLVTAVSGWCIGGGFILVQVSEYCVADETTKFVYPEAKIGLTGGMISSLAARIPHKIATEFIMLGEPMPAARAYEAGMINKIVPKGQHVEEAMHVARKLAGMAPLVTTTLKRFIDEMLPTGPVEEMCRTRLALERVSKSEDFVEGVAAFREKRPPRFQGR